VRPVQAGESTRPEVNQLLEAWSTGFWQDAGLAGVLALRPEILKAVTSVAAEFYSGRIEHNVMEALRRSVAVTLDDPYGSTVEVTVPPAPGDTAEEKARFARREELARAFGERTAINSHSVDDEFFDQLRSVFTDKEIAELATACAIFMLNSHFNIVLRVDTDAKSRYPKDLVHIQEPLTW
jgi:hypothetical protein